MNTCPGKKCNAQLDELGDHLASCMKSGRVKLRANKLESCWAQVFREAGGRVVPNTQIRNLNLWVDPADTRRVEFAVYGLPLFHGVPLLCDVTQVSPLQADGTPHNKCCTTAGVCLERAEDRKRKTYKEAETNHTVKLVTLACEVGGRWSDTCIDMVNTLARIKAKEVPLQMQRSTEYAYSVRWWSLLSCAAQVSFASSILEINVDLLQPMTDTPADIEDVFDLCRHEDGPRVSRMPLSS